MQQHPLVKYILNLTLLSIVLCFAVLFSIFFLELPVKDITSNIPYYILMFYTATGLSYAAVYIVTKKKTMRFENIFMITKFAKLFLYLAVFVLSILFLESVSTTFIICFLAMYLCYQVFDTITLRKLSKNLK